MSGGANTSRNIGATMGISGFACGRCHTGIEVNNIQMRREFIAGSPEGIGC